MPHSLPKSTNFFKTRKTRKRGPICPLALSLFLALLTLLVSSLALPGTLWAAAAPVALAWDPSPNPDTDIAGYRIYARTDTEAYQQKWNGVETQGTLTDLSPGTNYYFVVRAVTTTGVESPDSNEVAYQTPALLPPTANAGPDLSVYAGQTTTLDGSGSSDDDGTIVTYQWAQTAGLSVNLSDPNASRTSFTAPNVDTLGGQILTFELTVSDDDGLVATGNCSVAVNWANAEPVAASQNLTTDEDQTLSVNISGSDADGDALTFAVVSSPANGTLSGVAPSLVYTPHRNYFGSDSFAFRVNDGLADSNTATVNISVEPVNDTPVAHDGAVVTDAGVSAEIILAAQDVDSTNLAYSIIDWPQNGNLSGEGPTWTYTPTSSFSGSDRFTFKASDGAAESNLGTVEIIVNSVNKSPVADAGPDQNGDEGSTIWLDGSNSTDPDGDEIFFEWVQTGGILVQLSDPMAVRPEFTAPDVSIQGASLTFELTISDAEGLQSRDNCIVNVTWENQPPVADAGLDRQVSEGGLVILDGSNSSDPDDGTETYRWKQTSGIPVELWDPAAMRLEFTAPDVDMAGAALGFELVVADAGGLQSRDSCIVNVTWGNQPPVAQVGPDGQCGKGERVTLDGSASWDPDDWIASYRWKQTSGIPVTLSDPTAAQPEFTAPDASIQGAELTFQLTVTDAGGLQSSGTSWISVAAQNDTVDIQRLKYQDKKDSLSLYAVSSMPGDAVLTAVAHYGDSYIVLGEIPYFENPGGYRISLSGMGGRPDRVTVVSSYGGWDFEVP